MLKRSMYVVIIMVNLLFIIFIIIAGCSRDSDRNVTKIGVILPLTGEMAKYGKTIQSAAELAVEEINKKKGTKFVQFKLIFEDDRINPTVGVAAAKKLIDSDKVSAIVGPFASSVTLAVAPIAEDNHIVLLSPGSSSPKITDAGDYIFRNCLSDTYEGSAIASFVYQNLGLRKIAVIYINNEFGLGLKEVFAQTFKDLGGKIVVAETYEQGNTDFRTQLTKIHASSPQAIYLIGYEEMIMVFKQAKELRLKTQWLATTMLNDQSLVNKIGTGAADSTIFVAWEYSPESLEPRVKEFVTKFRARTGGIDPDVFAANTYDAIYILYEAIIKKGNNSSAIKDGLYQIKGFQGVTGETTFDKNGDVIKPLFYRTILNGKIIPYEKEKS